LVSTHIVGGIVDSKDLGRIDAVTNNAQRIPFLFRKGRFISIKIQTKNAPQQMAFEFGDKVLNKCEQVVISLQDRYIPVWMGHLGDFAQSLGGVEGIELNH
jgi:hypothetical protein